MRMRSDNYKKAKVSVIPRNNGMIEEKIMN